MRLKVSALLWTEELAVSLGLVSGVLMFIISQTETVYNGRAVSDGKSGDAGECRLGNVTRYVSTSLKRAQRWSLKKQAGKLLPDWRVSWCKTRLISGRAELYYSDSGKHSHFGGLMSCSSLWTCPVCSPALMRERRDELKRAVHSWQETGGSIVFLTLTLRHAQDDELAGLLSALRDAWRLVKSGRAWLELKKRYGIKCYVTALELTWSSSHGWHPHLHCLLMSSQTEHELNIKELELDLRARYFGLLKSFGRDAIGEYGLKCVFGRDRVAEYVSKYGIEYELSAVDSKKRGGVSPFELLDQAAHGDKQAAKLFIDYAHALHGKRQLTWSHGARELLGLGEERPDDELTGDELADDDVLLLELHTKQWSKVVKAGGECALLDVAEKSGGDAWQVWQYLQDELEIVPELWQVEKFITDDG